MMSSDMKMKYNVYLVFTICGIFLPIVIEIIKTNVNGKLSISLVMVIPLLMILVGNHLLFLKTGQAERAFKALLVAPHILVPVINLLEGPYSGVVVLAAILPLLAGLLLHRRAILYSALIMAAGMVGSAVLHGYGVQYAITSMPWPMLMALGFGNLIMSSICIYYFSYVNHLHAEEKVQLESRLAQSTRLASLGELAGGVAHEINNPLAIIVGNMGRLKRLQMQPEVDHKKSLSIVEQTNESALRISRIIESMRILARQGAPKVEEKEVLTAEKLVEEAIESTRERFDHRGVELTTSIDSAGAKVNGHPLQIHLVLVNLLNNAADAASNTSKKWVRLETQLEAGFLKVQVTDSGEGISEDVANKIFDPFFTTKDVGQGMGLGLSLSYKVAQFHEGKLWVDQSSANTSFVFELPIAEEQIQAA